MRILRCRMVRGDALQSVRRHGRSELAEAVLRRMAAAAVADCSPDDADRRPAHARLAAEAVVP